LARKASFQRQNIAKWAPFETTGLVAARFGVSNGHPISKPVSEIVSTARLRRLVRITNGVDYQGSLADEPPHEGAQPKPSIANQSSPSTGREPLADSAFLELAQVRQNVITSSLGRFDWELGHAWLLDLLVTQSVKAIAILC
jgi:hypothetical protein